MPIDPKPRHTKPGQRGLQVVASLAVITLITTLISGCAGHPNQRDALHIGAGVGIATTAKAMGATPLEAALWAGAAGIGKEAFDAAKDAPFDPIDAALTALAGTAIALIPFAGDAKEAQPTQQTTPRTYTPPSGLRWSKP